MITHGLNASTYYYMHMCVQIHNCTFNNKFAKYCTMKIWRYMGNSEKRGHFAVENRKLWQLLHIMSCYMYIIKRHYLCSVTYML